jgi:hypothetical protein
MNAGDLSTNTEATVPMYGKVWFHDKAMTNAFSLALMEDKYCVTYDSVQESAFIIHTPKEPVQFTRCPENLYYNKPKYWTTKPGTSMVETIKENESFYTPRQVNHARQACKLIHALGCPTVTNLKAIIWMNSITNCPVTLMMSI